MTDRGRDERDGSDDVVCGEATGTPVSGASTCSKPAPETPHYPTGSSEWVYESLVRTVPGIDVPAGVSVAVQLVVFQAAVLALAGWYGLVRAGIAGTVGVVVSVAGSVFMLRISREIRAGRTPRRYREVLFGSGIEVAFGVAAFCLLVVYAFVYDPARPGPGLVESLLGPEPPVAFAFLLLVIAWDVAYRIGVGWWASVVGLWRSVRYSGEVTSEARRRFRRADLLTIGFAAVQLLVVPVLAGHPALQAAVVGHAFAVAVVSGGSLLLSRSP